VGSEAQAPAEWLALAVSVSALVPALVPADLQAGPGSLQPEALLLEQVRQKAEPER
jgi:hypothetical protein